MTILIISKSHLRLLFKFDLQFSECLLYSIVGQFSIGPRKEDPLYRIANDPHLFDYY